MATAYVEIPLSGEKAAGRVAKVDVDDYEKVTAFTWNVWEVRPRSGSVVGPYAVTHVRRDGKRTTVQMHQVIVNHSVIDHEDHDGLNNCRSNLRDGTIGNNHNRRPSGRGSSQYKGVSWNTELKRWKASIWAIGVQEHLGFFDDEEEAARSYDAAALRLFGKYACGNFLINDFHDGS